MNEKNTWAVVVNFGYREKRVYATNLTHSSAETICKVAISKGYKNPRIMGVEEVSRMFSEMRSQNATESLQKESVA